MEREKGYDLVVCRWAWSQLRIHQEMERRWGWKVTAGEAVLSHSAGSHLQGRQTLSLEADLAQFYCNLTSQSQSQTTLSLDIPAMSSLILRWPFTFVLYSTIEGIRRQSSPERQEGFFFASGISFRLPEEHFTKRQITWSLLSSLSWSHHLKHTRQILSLLGFSWGTFAFLFLFLVFLKGICSWHAKMERPVSLLAALKILPNNTVCFSKSNLFFKFPIFKALTRIGP